MSIKIDNNNQNPKTNNLLKTKAPNTSPLRKQTATDNVEFSSCKNGKSFGNKKNAGVMSSIATCSALLICAIKSKNSKGINKIGLYRNTSEKIGSDKTKLSFEGSIRKLTEKEKRTQIIEYIAQYENLPDDKLLELNRKALSDDHKISAEQYIAIKHQMTRFEIEPDIFNGSDICSHNKLNGYNSKIRYIFNNAQNKENWLKPDEIKKIKQFVSIVDKEFDSLPEIEKDIVVYRGRAENQFPRDNIDFKMIDNSKSGDIIVLDSGYSYAALHRNLAYEFGGPGSGGAGKRTMIYEIKVPKGAKVSRNLEHGGEVVFPRNSKYKLISKQIDPQGVINTELEYILPKSQ